MAPQENRRLIKTEVRRHVDPFSRHKTSALLTHKVKTIIMTNFVQVM